MTQATETTTVARLHQNKEISAALEYALDHVFRLQNSGGHPAAILLCPNAERNSCRMSVASTPRNPQAHARQIVRFVDQCVHWTRPPG